MTRIFAKTPAYETREAMAPRRGPVQTQAVEALHRGGDENHNVHLKNRRSTGVDGVAQEALRAMFNDPGWRPRIAELLNDCFYRGNISEWLAKGASVLLPKTLLPQSWAEARPITLSNSLLKWLSQLLLLRGSSLLETCCRRQSASRNKQGVELITSLRKLARVAHKWKGTL